MTVTLVFTEKQNYRICSWWKCDASPLLLLLRLLLILLAVHPPLLSSELSEPVFREEYVFSSHYFFLTYGIIGSSAVLKKKNTIERYSISLYSARELQILTSFQSHRAESKSWEETATEKPGKCLHIQLFRNWGCICMLDIVRWKWHFSLFLPSSNL